MHSAAGGAEYRLTFASGALETASGPFFGRAGPPVSVEVRTAPQVAFGGAPLDPPPTVVVRDAGGTPVAPGVRVDAALAADPTGRAALAHAQGVTGANGTAVFHGLAIDRAGAGFVLAFSAGAAVGSSAALAVRLGPAAALRITRAPESGVFGVSLDPAPRLIAVDAGGNWVSTAAATVHAALLLPAGALPTALAGPRERALAGGVAVFDALSVDNALPGLALRFSSDGLAPAETAPFAVSGPPASVRVATQPARADAGGNATRSGDLLDPQPVVELVDHAGNIVRSLTIVRGVRASSASRDVAGTATIDIIRGTARFTDLRVAAAQAAYALDFAYLGPILAASTRSAPFRVTPGAPERLVAVQDPSSSNRGMLLGVQPAVQALDAAGNVAPPLSGVASAELFLGDTNMTGFLAGVGDVRGPAYAPFGADGVARFRDMSIALEADGLRMTVRAAGLVYNSPEFNVKQGPPARWPPSPPPRTNRTRRVPHPVLIGHAASLAPY